MTPIFLISQPRSGSTVLQAVLSNHPEVSTAAEPWIQLLRLPFVMPEKVSSRTDWNLVTEASTTAGKAVGDDILRNADQKLLEVARDYYSKAAAGSRYFLDKTPRYYYLLDRLLDDFPDARIIILTRHPAAVVSSLEKTWGVKPNSRDLNYFKDDLLFAPMMIKRFLHAHGTSERVYQIGYEDMIENPEGTLSALFEWLDLRFETDLLEYGENRKYSGDVGDPNAPKRNRLQAKLLPKGKDFLGSDTTAEMSRFCQGLVHHYERMGYGIPRKEWWLPGKPTFSFDYFLWSSGHMAEARSIGLRRILFHLEKWRRSILILCKRRKKRSTNQNSRKTSECS